MGGTITMVTQEGTTITIPAHELATQGAHSVTMVATDGSDEQVNENEGSSVMTSVCFSDFLLYKSPETDSHFSVAELFTFKHLFNK